MYHELLIALSGLPGAIFKADKYGGLEVTKNLPFLHPSEAELLDKLCSLGGHYRSLLKFIETYSVDLSPIDHLLKNDNRNPLEGQYLHAFCAGLTSVLKPYQDSLVQIERRVMKDPYTSLSHIHRGLEEYFFIFPVLSGLVETMDTNKLHGCQVLELLYNESNTGNPTVRKAILKILHACHGVLFKQLSAWMIYGILMDEYDEFFISMKSTEGGKRKSETDEVDGAVLSSETILRGVSGREVLEELQLDDDELSSSKHEARIMVVPNMLPTYIPLRLAQKILFIGESVQMLKDTENLKIHHYDENIGNLLQGRENDFLKTLHDLQERQEFSIPALEVEVDKIKACVAEQLWKLVVEDADLIKHLKLLKEMYLLGRGELYLTLIDHLHTTMKGPPTTVMSYDISAAFKQSLAKILTYSEEYEDLFELKLDMKTDDQTSNEKFKSTWDLLRVQYNPPWPLHLLFTPSIMEKLNMLFTFLLKVRRTQIELQGLWAFLMSAKRSGKIKMTSGPIWVLRRRMAFFIDNLQYYLQVDVLETQFSLLISKIHKTQSFENINRSLDNFLIEMLKQSFVSMKKVFNILHEIIYHCMAFCETVTSSDDLWDTSSKTEERIERIAEEYKKQTSLLFTILSSVRSHQTSPHLAQLLLRIDFNKFFTKKSAISMTSSSSSSKDLL